MTAITSTETQTHCLRCGRKIKSGTYGPKCAAKVRQAAAEADLSPWTPAQIEQARELIEDGGVVPSARPGVFHTVSTDGTEVHRTHSKGCNCVNGLQTRPPRPCLHRCAVAIVLASQAPADVVPAVPAAIPAPAPAGDFEAEMERLTEAFMYAA